MERRYEPMGGEEDSSVSTFNATSNNFYVASNGNSSTTARNFEDDLTLKVRTLLLNLEGSEGEEHSDDGTSVNSREGEEQRSNAICKCNVNSKTQNDIPSDKDQDSNCIGFENQNTLPSYTQSPELFASAQVNLYQSPPIVVVEHVEPNSSPKFTQTSCVTMKKCHNATSYHTFSNTLRNANKFGNLVSTPVPDFYGEPQEVLLSNENEFSGKPIISSGDIGKTAKAVNTRNKYAYCSMQSKSNKASDLKVDSILVSKSPEREAERSWSEITVTNESFMRPHLFPNTNAVVGTETSQLSGNCAYDPNSTDDASSTSSDSRPTFPSRDEYINNFNALNSSLPLLHRQISFRRPHSDSLIGSDLNQPASSVCTNTNYPDFEKLAINSRFSGNTHETSSRASAPTLNASKTTQMRGKDSSKHAFRESTNASRVPSEVSGPVSRLNSNMIVYEVEKEYDFLNVCSVSSISDRETPPLSASSVASSRRLEWDNGADIGYTVAGLNAESGCKRIIPQMARSEPEGISLLNDTSVGSTQTVFPSFTYPSLTEEEVTNLPSLNEQRMISYGRFSPSGDMSSQASSAEDDVVERSSSPGSLSRSDSKKSVIYNSVRDMHSQSKAFNSSPKIDYQPHRNLSCPNLAEVKCSGFSHDWCKAKSEEQVSSTNKQLGLQTSAMKSYHYPHPNFNLQSDFCPDDKIASSLTSSRISTISNGQYPEDGNKNEGSLQTHESVNSPHTCKSCNTSLIVQSNPNSSSFAHPDLPKENLESSDPPNFVATYGISQAMENDENQDWYSETSSHDSDLQYIAGVSEFSESNNLMSLDSRPMFLLSNSSSKLRHSGYPRIVRSFFNVENVCDQNFTGNSETSKPHIRWYPFTSTPSVQDIKNVSTQTAVSFIAENLTDLPALSVSCQQTSSPEETPPTSLNHPNLDLQGVSKIRLDEDIHVAPLQSLNQSNLDVQEGSISGLNHYNANMEETSNLHLIHTNLDVLEAYRLRLNQSNLNIQESLRLNLSQSSNDASRVNFILTKCNVHNTKLGHNQRNLDAEDLSKLSLNKDGMIEESASLSASAEEYKEERRRPNLSGSSNPSMYPFTIAAQQNDVRSLSKETNTKLSANQESDLLAHQKVQQNAPDKSHSMDSGSLFSKENQSFNVLTKSKDLERKRNALEPVWNHLSEESLTETELPNMFSGISDTSSTSCSKRKLGVGECQTVPKTLDDDSSMEILTCPNKTVQKRNLSAHLSLEKNPMTVPVASNISNHNYNTQKLVSLHNKSLLQTSNNVQNMVVAFNQGNQDIGHHSDNSQNYSQNNLVRTRIATLNDLHHSVPTIENDTGNKANKLTTAVCSDIASTTEQHLTSAKPNLLEFLAQNKPGSWSNHPHNVEGIPKSHSDPLLADNNRDELKIIKHGHSKTDIESQPILHPEMGFIERQSSGSQTESDQRFQPETSLRKGVYQQNVISSVQSENLVNKPQIFVSPTCERSSESKAGISNQSIQIFPENGIDNAKFNDQSRKEAWTPLHENRSLEHLSSIKSMEKADRGENLRAFRFSKREADGLPIGSEKSQDAVHSSLSFRSPRIIEQSSGQNRISHENELENATKSEYINKMSSETSLVKDFVTNFPRKEVGSTKKERRKWELADPFLYQLERNKIKYSRTSNPTTGSFKLNTEKNRLSFVDPFPTQRAHRIDNSRNNEFYNKDDTQSEFMNLFSRDENRHSLGSQTECDYTKSISIINSNCASIGIQVPSPVPQIERCSFCSVAKSSHHSQCLERDRFKSILNQSLEKRLAQFKSACSRSGTSFCVFSAGCACCCSKTLQEAFNFHCSELVEKIEARKMEVENMQKGLFVNQACQRNPNHKLKIKPVNDRKVIDRPSSNKENIKKCYDYPSVTSNRQRSRLKNLKKYNRVMSKIYSQRLKNEILKGKVNFHRHEILMNS